MRDDEYTVFMFGPVKQEQAIELLDYLSKIVPWEKIRRISSKEVPPAVEAENEFLCMDTGAPFIMKTTFVRLMLKYSFELMPLKGNKLSIYEKRGRFGPDTKFVIFKVKYSELEARVRKDLYEIADLTKRQNVLRIMESHTAPPIAHLILGPFVNEPEEGQFCMDDMELFMQYVLGDKRLHEKAMPMARVGYGESEGPVFTEDAMQKDTTLQYRKGPVSVKYGDLGLDMQKLVKQKMDDSAWCIVLRYSFWYISPDLMTLINRVKKEPRHVLCEMMARAKFTDFVKHVVREDKGAQEITNRMWDIAVDIAPELDETMARAQFIRLVEPVLREKNVMPDDAQKITDQTWHILLEMRRELKPKEVACPVRLQPNGETEGASSFVDGVGLRDKLMGRRNAEKPVEGNATRLGHKDKTTQQRSKAHKMRREPKPQEGACPVRLPPNGETGGARSSADRADLRAKLTAKRLASGDLVERSEVGEVAIHQSSNAHKNQSNRQVVENNDDYRRIMYLEYVERTWKTMPKKRKIRYK